MTPNAVRKKLRRIRTLKKEISIISQQIEKMRVKAEGAGGFKTEFVAINGFVTSKIEDYVAKIIEYQGRLVNKKLALEDAVADGEGLLELLNDQDGILRAVLRCIYILGKTQEQTAADLAYSERRIRQLEWQAVCKIAKRSKN